ncbi:MAG: AraC family transcriptional regulator [Eubacteriales bacterium]|nr:AraC family transcriptional regulator [Eubacteriales bacterium]
MDWIAQLNAMMDYIEENLDGQPDPTRMARMADCSFYNFERMFSYIAGQPLGEYIRSRRMTRAAFDLLHSDARVLDVAVKYGYASQDAFSRAFRAFHGVLPSAARKGSGALRSCPKRTFALTVQGGRPLQYHVEDFPAFTVGGYRCAVRTETSFSQVPRLWDASWENGQGQALLALQQQACRPAGLLGIACGRPTPGNMDYWLGVCLTGSAPLPRGMETLPFPAARWAIFQAEGALPDSVQNIYRDFYQRWLPDSGCRMVELPVVECYLPNSDRQEVWMPLVAE